VARWYDRTFGGLGDPGAAGYPADDLPGAVPVQPPTIGSREYRPFAASADGQVNSRAVRGADGSRPCRPCG
jgi:hypothetical protein